MANRLSKRRSLEVRPLHITWWLGLCLVSVNGLIFLIWGFGLAVGAHLFPDEFARLMDPDAEANFTTWYSSCLLTLVAVAALANFCLDGVKTSDVSSRWRLAWLGLALVTFLLSMEEVAGIHEWVQRLIAEWTYTPFWEDNAGKGGWSQWIGKPGRAWIIPYSPLIIVVVVAFFMTFFHMFQGRRAPLILALAGISLWVFALVLEFFLIEFNAWGPWYFMMETIFEEAAEISGSSSLLIAFVWYGEERWSEIVRTLQSR